MNMHHGASWCCVEHIITGDAGACTLLVVHHTDRVCRWIATAVCGQFSIAGIQICNAAQQSLWLPTRLRPGTGVCCAATVHVNPTRQLTGLGMVDHLVAIWSRAGHQTAGCCMLRRKSELFSHLRRALIKVKKLTNRYTMDAPLQKLQSLC